MKVICILLALSLPAVAAIAGAVVCAVHHVQGWGWLLFAAMVMWLPMLGGFKYNENDNKEEGTK